MKKKFYDMPLQEKLASIVMVICGVLTIFMAVCFVADKVYSFRRDMVENLGILADTIGKNSTAALVFDDKYSAEDTLSALKAAPYVHSATILINDKSVFARYYKQDPSQSENEVETGSELAATVINLENSEKTYQFEKGRLDLIAPIKLEGNLLGYITIRADLQRLYNRLILSIITVIAVILAVGVLAQIVSVRFHSFIAMPLYELLKTMEAVKKDKQYSSRAKKEYNDELGALTDSFNSMLAEIEKRDEELGSYQNELEKKVAKRTEELLVSNEQLKNEISERRVIQDQLARAQRMEAIGTLAAGVAHDLNNILSGVVSYPDLLLMRISEDHEMYAPLHTIQKSGKKAAAIVQDLLTLARRGVIAREVVDFEEVVDEYLASPECAKLLETHPLVEIESQVEPALMKVKGSVLHLHKTVMNLVSNGAEAMIDHGHILIKLENCYLDKCVKGYQKIREGYYVLLTVSDNGHGITEEDLNFIFEPFYTKKKMGLSGTGLGMAVVWGAVQDHKGYIDVVSTPGKGTTFSLYFPATVEESKQNPVANNDILRGNGESILVVDDVEEQRIICSEMLKELGYKVAWVSSGEEAVEYLKTNSADLLVLDMIMEPGIDGLETYRQIQTLHPKQKALIASGYSDFNRIKMARKLGVVVYLRKPYTLSNISRVVREELDRDR